MIKCESKDFCGSIAIDVICTFSTQKVLWDQGKAIHKLTTLIF